MSEVRLVCMRNVSLRSRWVPAPIFGTDEFRPSAWNSEQRSRVCNCSGPWPRKCALVLDVEFKLQVLAPVIRVEAEGLSNQAEIFFFIPVQRWFRKIVIEEPIAFHHMQRLGMRRPKHIDPWHRAGRP